jgi:hypothetical protein
MDSNLSFIFGNPGGVRSEKKPNFSSLTLKKNQSNPQPAALLAFLELCIKFS